MTPRGGEGRPGLVAFLILLLVGGGGFAGWYYLLRKPAPTTSAAGTSTAATTTAASPPAASPPAAAPPVDSALLRFDRVSDSVGVVVRGYETHMRQFTVKQASCTELSQALVAVEDAWTDYNVGKRKAGSLDATRGTRDQSLYAAVDSVERAFDRSGCERP